MKNSYPDDLTSLDMLKNIKSPEKFSKTSKNIDRLMKNFSLESIRKKLSNPIKLRFSGKYISSVDEIAKSR